MKFAGIAYTIPNVKMVIWPYLRQARLKNDIRQKQLVGLVGLVDRTVTAHRTDDPYTMLQNHLDLGFINHRIFIELNEDILRVASEQ